MLIKLQPKMSEIQRIIDFIKGNPFLPGDALLARYMLWPCLSVRQSVCHNAMFYQNG